MAGNFDDVEHQDGKGMVGNGEMVENEEMAKGWQRDGKGMGERWQRDGRDGGDGRRRSVQERLFRLAGAKTGLVALGETFQRSTEPTLRKRRLQKSQ